MSIDPSTHLLVYLFILLFVHLFIGPSIFMPAYQLFCLLLYQLPYPHTRYLFIVIFVHSSIFALIDHLSFVCLYVHSSIHPFAYLSVNPLPIPPFIHHCLASICPFILLLLFYLFIFFVICPSSSWMSYLFLHDSSWCCLTLDERGNYPILTRNSWWILSNPIQLTVFFFSFNFLPNKLTENCKQ